MFPDITSLLFYVFATLLMGAALAVITSKNPVHSVFFLIVAFFNAAGLFVLLGAEYIAMTLVIVYVGAVAVLFLFVVMMLNINFEKLRAGFIRMLPLGLGVAGLLFIELGALLYQSLLTPAPVAEVASAIPDAAQVSNARAIGEILYTDYLVPFQLSGLILLVAMIGAIVLTHRQRLGVKRQNINEQLGRTRAESMTLVERKSGQGA
ncbi:MAG: NADH-quinone oxidoreductase subunit J [Rickettsiales bacterium]